MSKRTIKLKKYVDINEEMVAHAAITPGMLVQMRSDGKVQKHGTAAANAIPMFALEDELQGKGIDSDYAETDPVQVWIPQRGEQVLAILKDDETVVIGDLLVSGGNGELQKAAPLDSTDTMEDIQVLGIVGVALEALDLSSSSGTFPATGRRIKIRVA